jgi:hypothetical protein
MGAGMAQLTERVFTGIIANIVWFAVVLSLSVTVPDHFSYSQAAQNTIITFDTIGLALGLPQESVMAALRAKYDLVNVGGTGYLWHVRTKPGPFPPRILGSLRFQDGKLVVIQKSWGPEDQKRGFDFARNLYLVLNQLPKELLTSCKINLQQADETTHESLYINFLCGEKLIAVSATRVVGGPFAPTVASTIEEVLK